MSGTNCPATAASAHAEVVDPDVDAHGPVRRWELNRQRFVLPVIALGGVLGACLRYAAAQAWPTSPESMPWTTLGVNTLGCALIGVLMVFVVELGGAHPLLRPFAGVGVLGGFTTFSTYSVDTSVLIQAHRPGLALAYWAGTLALALTAVTVGVVTTRLATRALSHLRQRRRGPHLARPLVAEKTDGKGGQ